MPDSRHSKYLHPFIATRLDTILEAINAELPRGHKVRIVSTYRSPDIQFELFKKGRTFQGGNWVVTGDIVTGLDGYIKRSRHNYLPCSAIDIGIFKDGVYLKSGAVYDKIGIGKRYDMNWGGDWREPLVDRPHLEIPYTKFFKSSIEKDSGLVWQKYLQKAGVYGKAMDGIFGPESLKALKHATDQNERNVIAWDILFDRFRLLES